MAGGKSKPYPYDLMLAGAGYMLTKGPGGQPAYSESKLDFFPPRQTQGDVSYANFPPDAEATWALPDFSSGFGQRFQAQPANARYFYGLGVDCRVPGQVVLGPQINTAVTGGSSTVTACFELANKLYLLAGRYCVSSSDGQTWSVSKDFGAGAQAKSAALFRGSGATTFAFVGLGSASGDPAYWVFDGTTWTQDSGGRKAEAFAVVGDELWRAFDGNKVAKSVDGGLSAIWAAAITVGDAAASITGLIVMDNRLYITKEDGFFTLSSDATQVDQDLLPELRGRRDGYNGRGATVWRNELWLPFRQGLYRYVPGEIAPAGPELETANTSPVRGRVTACAGDDYFLYVALRDDAGVTYLLSASGSPRAWHPLAQLGNVECRHMFVSGVPGPNPRLYFGRGPDVGYVVLPRSTANPLLDANCRFATSGSLHLPRFDGGFSAQEKTYLAFSILGENLLAGSAYVDVYYRTSASGSFSLLGRYGADPGERFEFPLSVVAKFIELRLNLVSSDSASTPIVRSIALAYAVRTSFKRRFTFNILAADSPPLLSGQRDTKSAAEIADAVEAAAGASGALSLIAPDGNAYEVLVVDVAKQALRSESGRPLEFTLPVSAVEYRSIAVSGLWDRAGVYTWDQLTAWTWGQAANL